MSAKRFEKKNHSQLKSISQVKKKNRQTGFNGWFLIGLGLTGLAALSATAGALLAVAFSSTPLKQNSLSPEQAAVFNQEETISYENLHFPKLTRSVNIVVLGTKVLTSDVENYNGEELGYHALVNSFEGLSDTMLLLRFDSETKKLTLLSIPRDTKAFIEGHGIDKINAANDIGGPALAAQTISNLLEGVSIDRYVRINVQGVEKLIDALGGVTVHIPKDMKYNDYSQHLYINFKAGKQHLDGEKAVQFLRFRYDKYGDIGRVQRQQMLMRSVVEQLLKPSVVVRLPKIISVIQSHVDTNLTLEELFALAGFAAQTKRSNVQLLMLPGRFSGDGKHEVSYWLPDSDRIKAIASEYFNHVEPIEQVDTQEFGTQVGLADHNYLRVAIQDSTGDPEAVKALTNYLLKAGYRNIYVSDEWPEPLAVTRIIAQQGDINSAAAISVTLGFGEVLVESTGALTSDISIQLGQDWRKKLIALENPSKSRPWVPSNR